VNVLKAIIIKKSLPQVPYQSEVTTGCGTDVNVYIFLFGENGDSGERVIGGWKSF